MSIESTHKIVLKGITNRMIDDDVMLFAQQTFFKAMDGYIPYRDGALQKTAVVTKDGVTFTQLYSRFQYYGDLMVGIESRSPFAKKDEKKEVLTPIVKLKHDQSIKEFATARWDEEAMRAKGEQVANEIGKYIAKKFK